MYIAWASFTMDQQLVMENHRGTLVTVSSEGLEKPRIEPETPGLQGEWL